MLNVKEKIPMAVRRAVYKRDDYACILCQDTRSFHLHHVIPRSRGGKHTADNLVCLCPICHAVVHGECELKNQFPFDRETAKDAVEYYLIASLDADAEEYPF